MKIEDIKYTLPTEQIDVEGFDKAKWLKENPIDYRKPTLDFNQVR